MKKLIIISLLAISFFSSSVVAKEKKAPTIEQTVGFLNKVFSSDDYSRIYADSTNSYEASYFSLPIFQHQANSVNECKIKLKVNYMSRFNFHEYITNIDLSMHKIYLKNIKDYKYSQIIIEDNNKIKTINIDDEEFEYDNESGSVNKKTFKTLIKKFSNADYSSIHSYYKIHNSKKFKLSKDTNEVIIRGKYNEKVKKALDHLTNICFKKYGKEDLF